MAEQFRVAVVLPPRESFSPLTSGAIALLAHRLARAPSDFVPTIFGSPATSPFADVAFQPVRLPWWPASVARRFAMAVARHITAHPPAIVEVHNRPDVALYLARRFPKLPVSLILHNDPQGMRQARTARERTTLLTTLASVTTVSTFLRARFLSDVAAVRPVAVLPNCIDLRDVPPAGPRGHTILFVGRVVADKGADTFVRACARALPAAPGWRAEIIGADRGSNSPETPFLAALRPEAAAARIPILGWRPHADVMAAMALAGMVIIPSRWAEPFGLTALEAMACGAPLLCSTRGGLPEVSGTAAVPIDPEDPEALAAAMVALVRDPSRRVKLGEDGRARARLFDVSHAAAALDALRHGTIAAGRLRGRSGE